MPAPAAKSRMLPILPDSLIFINNKTATKTLGPLLCEFFLGGWVVVNTVYNRELCARTGDRVGVV